MVHAARSDEHERSGSDFLDEKEHRSAVQRLANYPLFADAQSESVQLLVQSSRMTRASCGVRLAAEGHPIREVVFVLRGAGRVFHTFDDGREVTLELLLAPSHFGDADALAGRSRHGVSFELVSDSIIACVPWETLRSILMDDPAVSFAWLGASASSLVFMRESQRHLAVGGLKSRIANLLLSYARALGREGPGGEIEIELPWSRPDVARQVGSVRRSVLRILHELEEEGVVVSSRDRVVIKRPERLEALGLPESARLCLRVSAGANQRSNSRPPSQVE